MMSATELERLGREAAEQVAGAGAVQRVEVAAEEDDLDRPTYVFSFLIDQASAHQRAGLVRTRLIQALRDALVARSERRYPVVRIFDRTDWERRSVA